MDSQTPPSISITGVLNTWATVATERQSDDQLHGAWPHFSGSPISLLVLTLALWTDYSSSVFKAFWLSNGSSLVILLHWCWQELPSHQVAKVKWYCERPWHSLTQRRQNKLFRAVLVSRLSQRERQGSRDHRVTQAISLVSCPFSRAISWLFLRLTLDLCVWTEALWGV